MKKNFIKITIAIILFNVGEGIKKCREVLRKLFHLENQPEVE